MISDQRHYSEPFVGQDNLLITESTVCFRRASASLVEMLRCSTHSLTKIMNPSPCLSTSQDPTSTNSTENSMHVTDYLSSNSAQNPSFPSPLLPPQQHSHHDSAGHFSSLPPNLQRPSELYLSVPRSPQPHRHCKACMSLLLRDRKKGGGSLGDTHTQSFSTSTQFTPVSKPGSPTSPHQTKSPPVTLPSLLTSPCSSSSNTYSTHMMSPSHLSPPSQVVLPRSLYEGGDLTLLNHCLHHIVSRRTSSPSLSERGAFCPVHNYELEGTSSSVVEHKSLDVPLVSSPNLDRKLLFSPHDSKGQPDPLVG